MKELDEQLWISEDNIGKKMLVKRNTKDYEIYYIFTIKDLLKSENIDQSTYILENAYYFSIPSINEIKCYCYDNINKFTFDWQDKVYLIDANTYLTLFRFFVQNDSIEKTNINFEELFNIII